MTDHNSMKADEYAQQQGEMDDMDDAISAMMVEVECELPVWVFQSSDVGIYGKIEAEAKRRVMQAIKERNEP